LEPEAGQFRKMMAQRKLRKKVYCSLIIGDRHHLKQNRYATMKTKCMFGLKLTNYI